MIPSPALRKLALTAHVTASLGWLGAVAAFLALAVTGIMNENDQVVRSSYVGMDLVTKFVIVPSCLASLLTGIISSLITPWGLFRHYWVLIKLLLTFLSTVILLLHTQSISYLASVALEKALERSDLREIRIQLIADASAALLVLLVNTFLAIYKPRGLTKYGHGKVHSQKTS